VLYIHTFLHAVFFSVGWFYQTSSDWKARRNVAKRRRLDLLKWCVDSRFERNNSSDSGSDDDLFGTNVREPSNHDETNAGLGCPHLPDHAGDISSDSSSEDGSGDASGDSSDESLNRSSVSSDSNNSFSSASSDSDDGTSSASSHGEVLHFNDDTERENYLNQSLRDWATDRGVLSMRKLDSLLCRQRPLYPNISLSYKSLLSTGTFRLNIFDLPSGGTMW